MPDFFHSLVPVQINQVDRELHAEGMNRFAGNDPQSFSGGEHLATQQTLSTLGAVIGHVYTMRKFSLPSQIRDAQAHLQLRRTTLNERGQYPSS
jgi:hypothetical protein